MDIEPPASGGLQEKPVEFRSEEELREHLKTCILIDTCILVDLILTSRPRHSLSIQLYEHILASGLRLAVPAHAHFELRSAMMQEIRGRQAASYRFQRNEEVPSV